MLHVTADTWSIKSPIVFLEFYAVVDAKRKSLDEWRT